MQKENTKTEQREQTEETKEESVNKVNTNVGFKPPLQDIEPSILSPRKSTESEEELNKL
jgi:hypothetical protein